MAETLKGAAESLTGVMESFPAGAEGFPVVTETSAAEAENKVSGGKWSEWRKARGEAENG